MEKKKKSTDFECDAYSVSVPKPGKLTLTKSLSQIIAPSSIKGVPRPPNPPKKKKKNLKKGKRKHVKSIRSGLLFPFSLMLLYLPNGAAMHVFYSVARIFKFSQAFSCVYITFEFHFFHHYF